MRSFLERLIFPFHTYTDPPESLFPKKIKTGFIYTLGATEEMAEEMGFDRLISITEMFWRGSSALVKRYVPMIPTSLMIIRSITPPVLTRRKRRRDAAMSSLSIAKRLFKWGRGWRARDLRRLVTNS